MLFAKRMAMLFMGPNCFARFSQVEAGRTEPSSPRVHYSCLSFLTGNRLQLVRLATKRTGHRRFSNRQERKALMQKAIPY